MRRHGPVLLAVLATAAVPPQVTLTVRCRDTWAAAALRGALTVEARGAAGGSVVTFEDAGEDVPGFMIHIEADALGNLRAATRSCMAWLQAAEAALGAAGRDTTKHKR